jgi:hypothetical protein
MSVAAQEGNACAVVKKAVFGAILRKPAIPADPWPGRFPHAVDFSPRDFLASPIDLRADLFPPKQA